MKSIISSLFSLLAIFSFAQIEFMHGTLEEGLAKAKKENKHLFVDVYAVWCGPCKMMAATAFVDPEVAKYYNQNFISLKLDGEKNDGPDVMRKYGISAYPTLMYFKPDGALAAKVVGAMNAKQLISQGTDIINPERSPIYIASKKYQKSSKSKSDLSTYIYTLSTYESDSLSKYTDLYLEKYPNLNIKDSIEFIVFDASVHDYQHPLSKQFIEGDEFRVNQQIYLTKMNDFIGTSYQKAQAEKNYETIKTAIVYVYPFLQKCDIPDLPKLEEYLDQIERQF